MIEIESWMVRTAVVIMTLYLVDGALYFLHRWFQRRQSEPFRSRSIEGSQHRQDDASAFAETLS